MKDMDTKIDEKGMERLKSLIGMNLMAIGHDVFLKSTPGVFQRIELQTNDGFYYLDNPVEWRNEYFAQPDCVPCLHFAKASSEREIADNMGFEDFQKRPVNEKITDVWIIQDEAEILKSGGHYQNWKSTEGIVIETEARQYAFYKANVWFNETILVYKGHDVISKLEPIEKH